jgi:hypothetical protein
MIPGRMARTGFARRRTASSFDSVCDVQRNGTTIYAQVPCVVETPNDQNQQIEGESIPVGSFLVAMDVGHEILQGDFIIERGRILQVLRTATPKSYEVRLEAVCLKVGEV